MAAAGGSFSKPGTFPTQSYESSSGRTPGATAADRKAQGYLYRLKRSCYREPRKRLSLDPFENVSGGNPLVLLHDASGAQWLSFEKPFEIVCIYEQAEVLPALRRIERSANERGLYAAGFLSYEAAPAFDKALTTHGDRTFPLLWFGLFEEAVPANRPSLSQACDDAFAAWQPTVKSGNYLRAIRRIKGHIRDGDTYQVNYTYRLHTRLKTDPREVFIRMTEIQRAPYGGYIETDDWVVCSASPELFFSLDGQYLVSRPMKGTAPRGPHTAGDMNRAAELRESGKNRAENVMIVDMVRNDFGRVCTFGSVRVPSLFDVEKYETLWQLTSTVEGETDAGLVDIMRALFPAASITGAPKVRTMEIIAALENTPRRIYTGTMGFLMPGRRAQFNVAIRTALINRNSGLAEYGTGGGIVWDSEPGPERNEAKLKARILFERRPTFSLLETMRWERASGYHLLERHLGRLADSAEYFDYRLNLEAVRSALFAEIRDTRHVKLRVRMEVTRDGHVSLTKTRLDLRAQSSPFHVAVARHAVDRNDPFLYHKTTHREVYDRARLGRSGVDDVILYNEEGEVTESTIANVVVCMDDKCYTPPVTCGLLAGTERARMIDEGLLAERILRVDDLWKCDRLFLRNSVRGMFEATPTS